MFNEKIFDEEMSDEQVSDEQVSDEQVSDEQVSDVQLSNEQGNTLIESMIALSLFSLITINVSLLFLYNKALEKKSLWYASVNCTVRSIWESGYNSRQYHLGFWEKKLAQTMSGSEIRLEFGVKRDDKSRIKIVPRQGTGLNSLEYEF